MTIFGPGHCHIFLIVADASTPNFIARICKEFLRVMFYLVPGVSKIGYEIGVGARTYRG